MLDAIFRYDILTQPAYHSTEAAEPAERLPVVELNGTEYFVREDVELEYDVPSIIEKVRLGSRDLPEPGRWKSDLYYRVGAEDFIGSTNHEEIVYFMGMTPAEVRAASAAR